MDVLVVVSFSGKQEEEQEEGKIVVVVGEKGERSEDSN
jgi:hypothetical protein